tara:strand:- start:1136 stop:1609 length:474 start_codon:yes stop_codon:yes gene_type:complete
MPCCPTSLAFKKQVSFGFKYGKLAAISRNAHDYYFNTDPDPDWLLSDEEIFLYLDDDIAVSKDIAQDAPFHIVIWFMECSVRNVLETKDRYPEKFEKVMNSIKKIREYLGLEELKVWFTEREAGQHHSHIQVTSGESEVQSSEDLYRKIRLFFKEHY